MGLLGLLGLALVIGARAAEPQLVEANPAPASVIKFLKEQLPDVRHVETGTWIRFNDRFIPLPEELHQRLRVSFPDREFYVADMSYLHWGFDPVKLLLVLRRGPVRQADGAIVEEMMLETYAWALWFDGDVPFTFGGLLRSEDFERSDVELRITALAGALAFLSGDAVGACRRTEEKIWVEILDHAPNGRSKYLTLSPEFTPIDYRLKIEKSQP